MKPPAVHPPGHRRKAKPAASAPLTLPIGVAILAVLHLIIGGFLIGVSFFIVLAIPNHGLLQNRSSIPNQILLLVGVVGSVIFAAGLGMLLRHRWGWWWAAFNYTCGLFESLLVLGWLEWLQLASREAPIWPLPSAGAALFQIALSIGLLYYLCRPWVLAWFYQPRLRVPVALALLSIVSVVVLAVTYASLYFVGVTFSG